MMSTSPGPSQLDHVILNAPQFSRQKEWCNTALIDRKFKPSLLVLTTCDILNGDATSKTLSRPDENESTTAGPDLVASFTNYPIM